MPLDRNTPTLADLADEFAADLGSSIDRYVEHRHPGGDSGAWRGTAQRETNRRLRAAIAQRLIGDTDERLCDLVAGYNAAADAVDRCMSGGEDEAYAAEARVGEFGMLVEQLADDLRGEAIAYAPTWLGDAA